MPRPLSGLVSAGGLGAPPAPASLPRARGEGSPRPSCVASARVAPGTAGVRDAGRGAHTTPHAPCRRQAGLLPLPSTRGPLNLELRTLGGGGLVPVAAHAGAWGCRGPRGPVAQSGLHAVRTCSCRGLQVVCVLSSVLRGWAVSPSGSALGRRQLHVRTTPGTG